MRRHLLCLLLLFSVAASAQQAPVALEGTLVTPQDVIPHGIVLMQNGKITASGVGVKVPTGTKVAHMEGVIAPGFIDLHNHLTYNVFPRWKPIEEFGSRYDWQQKPVYNVLLSAPYAGMVKLGMACDMERYAEIKAITEGETSLVGGLQQSCSNGLARNLDYDPELGASTGKIIYNVFPFQMSEQQLAEAKTALGATPRGSLLIHVAEGGPNDASASREFTMLKGRGLLLPGVSVIHGVGIKPENFVEMAKAGVGFVWSPRSNIELYGDTARVAAAKAAGVQMAIAPDWSPTGSDGTLGELNYASRWNQGQAPPPTPPLLTERDLVLMATATPAAMVNLSGQVGSLAAGNAADLIVVRQSGDDAYWSLTHTAPQDLELVVIGGQAIYGDAVLMKQMGVTHGEDFELCGTKKTIVLTGTSLADTEKALSHAMNQFGRTLAPLSECGN
jgi:5-methylthioadenosine/S-adenosylhomocysteine deaminase